ncbi:MAG: polysaccharide deacetylase family protein [Candidatus Jordarchaeaceae archaeon]
MPVKGVKQAVSDILIPHFDGEKTAVFDCTIKGLIKTLELLNEFDLKATFFIEARTILNIGKMSELVKPLLENEIGCHGMDHEDLTGERTGVKIDYNQQLKILEEATRTIKNVLKVEPKGFRAPYLKANADTIKALIKLGYLYDSSISMETTEPPFPYHIRENQKSIIEVPVPIYPLNPRKMSLYTWALFERQRKIDEYKKIIKAYQKNDRGGLLQIAFHPWHLAYIIKEKRILKEKEIEKNVKYIKTLITQLKKDHVKILTVSEYLKETEI